MNQRHSQHQHNNQLNKKRQKSIELPALVSIQEAHIIQPTPTPTPMMESSSPPVS
ncbi:unnamed protein product, partial [Didymodactylos carnosus]